ILMLLTDGVLESKNARGDTFGLSRLTEVMEAAGANGMALFHPVLDAVEAFSGGRRHDDLTLVELRWC
ncbi:MAG TPA: SpoIIE family protein phosphatase, partial [Candidatus Methylomirabilis sp.]